MSRAILYIVLIVHSNSWCDREESERALSIERDASYCKRQEVGLRFLRYVLQLDSRTKLELYCIVFCLLIYDPFDGVTSNSEYKESQLKVYNEPTIDDKHIQTFPAQ